MGGWCVSGWASSMGGGQLSGLRPLCRYFILFNLSFSLLGWTFPLGIIMKQADAASFRTILYLYQSWGLEFSIIYSIRRVFSMVPFLFLFISIAGTRVVSSSRLLFPALMLLFFGVAAIMNAALATSSLLLMLASAMLRFREWSATLTPTRLTIV